MSNFTDYCKAVFANRITLGGFLLPAAYAASKIARSSLELQLFNENDAIFIPIMLGSHLALVSTNAGTETLEIYKKTRAHLEKHGKVDKRFFNTVKKAGTYCDEAGYQLAIREYHRKKKREELSKRISLNPFYIPTLARCLC